MSSDLLPPDAFPAHPTGEQKNLPGGGPESPCTVGLFALATGPSSVQGSFGNPSATILSTARDRPRWIEKAGQPDGAALLEPDEASNCAVAHSERSRFRYVG